MEFLEEYRNLAKEEIRLLNEQKIILKSLEDYLKELIKGNTYNVTINTQNTDNKSAQELAEKFIKGIKEKDKGYKQKKYVCEEFVAELNSRKDRISTIPNKPEISGITLTINDKNFMNINLTWDYENEDNIHGFQIHLHAKTSKENYIFGSNKNEEGIIIVSSDRRSYTIPNIPTNLYYTIGIRAYRSVDNDINKDGILLSEIVNLPLVKLN